MQPKVHAARETGGLLQNAPRIATHLSFCERLCVFSKGRGTREWRPNRSRWMMPTTKPEAGRDDLSSARSSLCQWGGNNRAW